MTPDPIAALASQFVAARRDSRPLSVSKAAFLPTDDAACYRVQDAVMASLGRRAVAWKVGAASPTSVPNGAPIFDLHEMSAVTPGAASTGVELEIAFTLGRDFPATEIAPTRAAVEGAISDAHVVLETCAARIIEGMDAPPLLRLADNGINLGLVRGPRIADWKSIDLTRLVARVEADGRLIAETTAGHTAPDLIGLLTWLVGHCVTQRGGLAAGVVVTTGSWMGIRFVTPPAAIRATFPGVGTIETRIVA